MPRVAARVAMLDACYAGGARSARVEARAPAFLFILLPYCRLFFMLFLTLRLLSDVLA